MTEQDVTEIGAAVKAMAEGYSVTAWGDRWIRVENPDYQPDNGSNPGLVIDADNIAKLIAGYRTAEARLADALAALDEAEACMSIVEPRSDKAEYLRILGVIRATLSRLTAAEKKGGE